MERVADQTVQELLSTILPWFDREHAFICDSARTDLGARLAVASALLESGKQQEGTLLLKSIAASDPTGDSEQDAARIRSRMEMAYLLMDEMKYDEAENLLWEARKEYAQVPELEFLREEISLLIAQCRFGQGFILEAVERAEEILHKLNSLNADNTRLAKVYQYLAWFELHKTDVPQALTHMKKAMELAPGLDREMVDAGLAAEKNNDYEKALEAYFDAIQYE
ncbi:tetratricopeptide repeat protein [Paenibacillus mesotrionivorans]|uniref:Tetratricopeptide repeat protein n=1 Tax=Paenibacillus mesotrionivorans TaxID=3160968 RepID=A0ACC7P458_9BACL